MQDSATALMQIRQRLDLTIKEMSDALGVPDLLLQRWESGLIPVPNGEMAKAHELFGTKCVAPTRHVRLLPESDGSPVAIDATALQKMRSDMGMTQPEMAEALKVTWYLYRCWEQGNKRITDHYARVIAALHTAHVGSR